METIQILPNPVPLPPLGVLLHQFRVGVDESVETVSRRGLQEPIEVVRLEIDRTHLGLDALEHIVESYRVPRTLFPVGRSRVVVDLVSGIVGVEVGEQDGIERQEDRILLTYLELLYDARGLAPGHALALTSLDTGLLHEVLSTRSDAVRRHLEELLERSGDHEPGELRRRILIAALALLAGGMLFVDLRFDGRPDTSPSVVTSQPAPVRSAAPSAFRLALRADWTAIAQDAVRAAPVRSADAASGSDTIGIETIVVVDTPDGGGAPPPVVVEIGDAVAITPDGGGAPPPVVVEIGDAVTITPDGGGAPPAVVVEIGDAVTITPDGGGAPPTSTPTGDPTG